MPLWNPGKKTRTNKDGDDAVGERQKKLTPRPCSSSMHVYICAPGAMELLFRKTSTGLAITRLLGYTGMPSANNLTSTCRVIVECRCRSWNFSSDLRVFQNVDFFHSRRARSWFLVLLHCVLQTVGGFPPKQPKLYYTTVFTTVFFFISWWSATGLTLWTWTFEGQQQDFEHLIENNSTCCKSRLLEFRFRCIGGALWSSAVMFLASTRIYGDGNYDGWFSSSKDRYAPKERT